MNAESARGARRIAANISTLFRELPLLDRFGAARAAGFDGVEMQFPYAEPADALADAAQAAGLPVVLINGPVMAPRYPFGIAGRPEMRAAFRADLPRIREYAERLGARFVHILAGVCDGPHEIDECLDTYRQNLALAADSLAAAGVQVLIEPLNSLDVPGYLLTSLDLAREVIERGGSSVGLQFDAYHAARRGEDPARSVMRVADLVRHVQFADAPGRHEPGTGAVAFGDFLGALDTAGYRGWVAAEYHPRSSTRAGLSWLTSWREASEGGFAPVR